MSRTSEIRSMRTLPGMQMLVVAMLCLTASISVVYFPITKFDIHDRATGGETGDVAQYIKMYQGVPLDDIPKPYRYRVLTPYLARLVPWLPESVSQFYEIDAEKIVKFKFGMINMLGLAATGFLLFLLCGSLHFSTAESLLACYMFFTSFFVVNYGGVPLVDALAYLFLVLGILSALRKWHSLLFISVGLGMFQKETCVLILISVILLSNPIRLKLKQICLCLPGIIAYLTFRLIALPTTAGYQYSFSSAVNGILDALTPDKSWIYTAIDGGLSFGAMWLLALHGFFLIKHEKDNPLVRLSILIPVVMIIPFLIGSNIGRIWFLAFPVVIPLSVVSLRYLLRFKQ